VKRAAPWHAQTMGCGGSKDQEVDTSAEDAASKELEARLENERKEEDAITKLLVLGTGESGKSTVFKQMKILYAVPDPPAKFIMVCRANLFGNAHAVAGGMKLLNIGFGSGAGEAATQKILGLPADGNADITPDLVDAFNDMYKDTGVQEAIERAAEYQLNDSTRYFWERTEELLKPDYLPTEQDVLRARVRTTGIVQQNFQIGERKYTMFDVGGQRNERRKWIHCFDNVTAVIFVTAISEYDQVLYEDASTNRMDEAVTLFAQICNHQSFIKTSMILFLNKRDLFMIKLGKDKREHPLSVWDAGATVGRDYDECLNYIISKFIQLNKNPSSRQIYCHATCATDTSNVKFVMDSVFDVVLKDNLRKLQKADLTRMLETSGVPGGKSGVKTGPGVWTPAEPSGKVLLCAAWYTDNLSESKVLTTEGALGDLPAVEMMPGRIQPEDFMWLMELGKQIPVLVPTRAEVGSFKGNFKEACAKLRELLGIGVEGDLGFLYDEPIVLKHSKHTLLLCVKRHNTSTHMGPFGLGFKGTWAVHEDFENPHYQKYAGVMEKVSAPRKDEEFNPFAANPVGFRWFKGVKLFDAAVSKIPNRGVYLGIFKVCSTPTGFKIMVNEHNRVMIPTVFLTESQLSGDEKVWMHGVRIREHFGIDLLEGGKPNMGWLGPEMSGEEGATFKEKLAWAVSEAKARLGIDESQPLGKYYDAELLQVDEKSNMQVLVYGSLAKEESDVLPGHIWVERSMLEVQNMKYYCPTVLQALLKEQQAMIKEYLSLDDAGSLSADEVGKLRKKREEIKERLDSAVNKTTPLKWVNRVIMWCADKMPSFGDQIIKEIAPGDPKVYANGKVDVAANIEANWSTARSVVTKAIGNNLDIVQTETARQQLLSKYM